MGSTPNLHRTYFISLLVLVIYKSPNTCQGSKILFRKSTGGTVTPIPLVENEIQSHTPVSILRDAQKPYTCGILPQISVHSYNRQDFQPNETVSTELLRLDNSARDQQDKIWLALFVATVEIDCVASVPIQWTFEGPQEPEVKSIDVLRTDPTASDCFRIRMKLVTRKKSTGKYQCKPITLGTGNPQDSEADSFYLYGDVNSPPFLLYEGKDFIVTPEASARTVTLPCQVANPNVTPDLYKGNSQVVSLQSSAPYNPQSGFKLDLEKIPDPFDSYKCSREGGSVYVTVKRFPEFRVNPPSVRLTLVEGETLTLTCEGVNPIGLQGFIDDFNITIIEVENEPFYKYKMTYDYYLNGTEPPTGISCVNLQTHEVYHTWHTTVISKQANLQSGIRYDPKSQRFYCYSKTEDSPTIALVRCNNPMECQLTDKCFRWNALFKLSNGGNTCVSENQIQRGMSCKGGERGGLVNSNGCAYVSNSNYFSGTVHCSLPDNGENLRANFFTGLKSATDTVIFNSLGVPKSELIAIGLLAKNRTFYTKEFLHVQCRAPEFLFAQGQYFKFQLEDGTFLMAKDVISASQYNYNGEDGIVVKNSNLELTDPRIRRVFCFSPLWNETSWMNNSIPVIVAASIKPKILEIPNRGNGVNARHGENISLSCQANGLPQPSVIWMHEGKKAENQHEVMDMAGAMTTAVLKILHANLNDEGEYHCQATNVAGTETLPVKLYVTQSKRTVYTALVIGTVTLAIFLTIVVILWRKLKKHQALVRHLTEKEVKEFCEGDTNALRSIPDGYIRAQYLPYDKEYEIKEENLEIDEEVLGRGEYGIVLKGTLRHKDSLKEVAVKISRTPDVNHFKALLTELKMLTYIGWHDNVINLLGAVTRNLRERDVYVVVEYCRLGDLESFLHQNRTTFLNQIVDENLDLNVEFNFNSAQAYQPVEYTMRTTDLLSWSLQIASGMEYLSEKKVIHGDLAARNILLTDDRTVKITDFGLSKHLYNGSNYVSHSALTLPWRHCAPEILKEKSFSTQSDVWSMGVTLWEVFSLGEIPYPGVGWSWDFQNQLRQGYRMDKPSFANQSIYNVILQCWKITPLERISFEELRKFFHRQLHHWEEEQNESHLTSHLISNNNKNSPQVGFINGLSSTIQQPALGNHYVVSTPYVGV